jgi:hypothetical protein
MVKGLHPWDFRANPNPHSGRKKIYLTVLGVGKSAGQPLKNGKCPICPLRENLP